MFGQELVQSTGLHKQTEDKTDCYTYSKAGETTVILVKCTLMYKVSGSLFVISEMKRRFLSVPCCHHKL